MIQKVSFRAAEDLGRALRLRRSSLIWISALLLGFIFGLVARHSIANQSVTLDVEALISNGTVFRVYYNNQWSDPKTNAVHPNQWAHYRFTVPSHLTALRFDPSEAAHAQTQIRSIVLTKGNAVRSQSLDPADLRGWLSTNITVKAGPGAGAVMLTTDAPFGYIMGTVNMDVGSSISAFDLIRFDGRTLFWSLLAAEAILLLLTIRKNQIVTSLFVCVLIVGAVLLARVTALWLLHGQGFFPPVVSTTGAASFAGFSKSLEQESVNWPIFMAVLLTAAAGIGWRWLRRESLPLRFSFGDCERVSLLPFFALLTVCSLFAFPPAVGYLASAFTGKHATDFDSQNIDTWEYLVRLGRLPWRDFWFPYSGFYNRLSPLYPDFLYEFLHEVMLLAVILWGSLKVFHNRALMVWSSCALFAVLDCAQVFWWGASPRYFLCLSIVLAAAVAVREMRVRYHVFLGVWCVYVVSQELSQVFYALPAAGLIFAAAIAGAPSRQARLRAWKCMLLGAAAGAGVLLLYLAVLAYHSQLSGWWGFVKSIGDQADYGAWPARIQEWVSPNGAFETGLLLLTLLLLLGGIAHLIWPAEPLNIYSVLPLSIGVVSWLLLQKQIIRPGIETQFIAIPLFGIQLLLYQRMLQAFRLKRLVTWLAFSMAALFSFFVLDAGLWKGRIIPWVKQVESVPHNVAVVFARGQWKQARKAYFAPAAFIFDGKSGTELRDRLSTAAPTAPDETVYVLGNNPLLYLLLNKPVPYYTNIYNESPISSQQTEVAWLEKNRPKYVFWDADANQFDGVPNPVRVPLVFTYIVEHYRPKAVEGKFQILQRLNANEPFAADYWNKMLGLSTDLGYVPATSALTENEGGDRTAPVLVVHVTSVHTGEKVSVPLRVGAYAYTVAFTERDKIHTYIIRLDRIPLLEAERTSGVGAKLSGPVTGGVETSIRQLPVSAADLY